MTTVIECELTVAYLPLRSGLLSTSGGLAGGAIPVVGYNVDMAPSGDRRANLSIYLQSCVVCVGRV